METSIQEPVWDTEYSEELNVPVPDLYPELSESLQNMQESDTEQAEVTKGVINCSSICSYIFDCVQTSPIFWVHVGKGSKRMEIKDICNDYRQFHAYNLFRVILSVCVY